MSAIYRLRVNWTKWWYLRVFSHLSGQRRIVRCNLKRVYADAPQAERRQLEQQIIGNLGRYYGELLNLDRFLPTLDDLRAEGPGCERFFDLVARGEPVILISGHIGNYVAGMYVLAQYGVDAGFFYRQRGSGFLDKRFERVLAKLNQPGFKIGHRTQRKFQGNLKFFLEFLLEGNVAVMLADHRDKSGPKLQFLGRSAATALTPARIAIQQEVPLIPCFVLRQGSSGAFRVWIEEPLEFGEPEEMMQSFNDVISEIIAHDPAQWSWTIRRW